VREPQPLPHPLRINVLLEWNKDNRLKKKRAPSRFGREAKREGWVDRGPAYAGWKGWRWHGEAVGCFDGAGGPGGQRPPVVSFLSTFLCHQRKVEIIHRPQGNFT